MLFLLPMITVPYVSRVLGPRLLGINAYVTSISSFFISFVIFGMFQYGTQQIARQNLENQQKLPLTFWKLFKLQLLLSSLSVFMFLIFSIFIFKNNIFLYLQLPYLIGNIMDISWYFAGVGKLERVIIRNTIFKLLSVIIIFIVVHNPHDLWIYILVNSITVPIANSVFWLELGKIIKDIRFITRPLRGEDVKNILLIVSPQFAYQFYNNVDVIIVMNLSNAITAGYYTQSQYVIRIIYNAITSLSMIIMPAMAKSGDKGSVFLLLKKSLDFTTFLSILSFLLVLINTNLFVPWFFGSNYYLMIPYLSFLCINILFISYGMVFSNQFLISQGLFLRYAIPYYLAALVSITLNFLFIPLFGGIGAIFSIIITELISCILRIKLTAKFINLKMVFKKQWHYLFSFIITFSLLYKLQMPIPSIFLQLITRTILATVIYILLLVMLKDELIFNIINHLFKA